MPAAYNGNGGFQFLQLDPTPDMNSWGQDGRDPEDYNDIGPYTEGAGENGTPNNDAGQGGNFTDNTGGSAGSSQGDMDQYESDQQPGVLDKLYGAWHSGPGKVATTLASLFIPGAGIPLALANLGLGLASGHGGSTIGGIAGSMAGSALGPIGSMVGGAAGGWAGNQVDSGALSGNGQGGYGVGDFNLGSYTDRNSGARMSDMDYGALGAGLGTALNARQGTQGLDSTIGGLQGLYSPNSPYAQQLQQQLERSDAASGRRSQYGTRSVELQARLADSAARMAPSLANMYQQRYNMQNQQTMGYLGAAKAVGAFDPNNYKKLYDMYNSSDNQAPNTGTQFSSDSGQSLYSGDNYTGGSASGGSGMDYTPASGAYDPYAGSTGTDSTWDWGNLFGGNSGGSSGSIFGSGG